MAEPAPLLGHAVQPGQRHLGSGAGEAHSSWNGLSELDRTAHGAVLFLLGKDALSAERTEGARVSGGLELPDALCPQPPGTPKSSDPGSGMKASGIIKMHMKGHSFFKGPILFLSSS